VSDVRAEDFRPPSLDTWVARERVEVEVGTPFDLTLLAHNPLNAVTGGIWRARGPLGSVVIKVVTDGRAHEGPAWWAASREDRHWNSWRREVLAYRERIAASFEPDGVAAPELRGADDATDGTVVLWLEDVHGRSGADLTVDDLVDLAGALGRAQGRLALAGDWDRPWLSRGFLREYSASKPVHDAVLEDERRWAHPRVERHLGALRASLVALRRRRPLLVTLAERVPRTLCHLDLWPPNVVRRPDGRFALLDWAFCGSGALGEDVSNLVPDSVFDLLLPAHAVEELALRSESAYVHGVRAAGWPGDERWIRLGIRAPAAKYHWLAARLLADPDTDPRVAYGGRVAPADELFAARAAGLRVLCRWADEAVSLAAELGIDVNDPQDA
jgi:hypothetical protein